MNPPVLSLCTQVLVYAGISLLLVFSPVFHLPSVLSFKPTDPLSFVWRDQGKNDLALAPRSSVKWLLHEEEEAELWSVLSGEVEQPLAQ